MNKQQTRNNEILPIADNRQIIGHAKSIEHAEKIIRQTIDIHPKMTLRVWIRPDHICEILSLPKAYTYSLSYQR